MTKFDLFDTIWEKTVEKTCEIYLEKYGSGNLVNHIAKSKKKARRYYYESSRIFVYSYMRNMTHNIDRHKIASCMVKSILMARPLRVSFFDKVKWFFTKENIDDKIYLANQYVAINVAVLILEAYIRSDIKKEFKHRIFFPEPFPDGEKNYIKDVCLDLYYTSPRNFNIITYADIFFLWEKYSCRRAQGENLEDKCKELLKGTAKSEEEMEQIINSIKYADCND